MENMQEIINQVLSLKEDLEQLKTQAVPIGAVEAFAMKDAPAGWLVCDGEMYSKERFPLLSKALGTTYNLPDTPEGFFCVPDLQGLFIRGWDNDGNRDGGRKFASIQEDALQGHCHSFSYSGDFNTSSSGGHSHKTPFSYLFISKGLGASVESLYKSDTTYGMSGYETDSVEHHSHCVHISFRSLSADSQSSKFGVVKKDKETRPKNIALLYCIKAENLPTPDTLAEIGYSTIVEKVKKELMSTIVPLSRTLPIVAIGGKEYLANIEKIKQSHFFGHPTNRQDLVYATAQCFNDICVYNVRNGQKSEQFDAFGLDLLVSWMVDKGMLDQKEKLLFIEEVKNYISSLLLAITPK